jgi:hypothetical protein
VAHFSFVPSSPRSRLTRSRIAISSGPQSAPTTTRASSGQRRSLTPRVSRATLALEACGWHSRNPSTVVDWILINAPPVEFPSSKPHHAQLHVLTIISSAWTAKVDVEGSSHFSCASATPRVHRLLPRRSHASRIGQGDADWQHALYAVASGRCDPGATATRRTAPPLRSRCVRSSTRETSTRQRCVRRASAHGRVTHRSCPTKSPENARHFVLPLAARMLADDYWRPTAFRRVTLRPNAARQQQIY